MHFTNMPVYASIAVVVGIGMFWRGFRELRLKRLIRDTPTARVRSMAMGLVEVNGVVETSRQVTAPFSGLPCAYWQVDIASQSRRRGWTVFHRNASGHPFGLRDDTGLALVYPQGAECKLSHQVSEQCFGLGLPDCYSSYMHEHVHGLGQLSRLGALRFRERILEEGQPIYVLASAYPKPQVHTVSEDETLAATGTDGAPMTGVRREAPAAILRRGENDPTFIISQSSERELDLTIGLRALGHLVGGPILALLGLGYWIYRLAAAGVRP